MPRVENGYDNCSAPPEKVDQSSSSSSFDLQFGENKEWRDVSQEFKTAAETLRLGELVHDENFSLFEAMSAIELMDPKMDAGMLLRSSKQPITFEDAVFNGTLKLSNVPLDEQIAIVDATIACLLTWLEGHSTAQTVFTILYTHKPYELEDRTLKAALNGLIKLVRVCGRIIQRAYVCEEEDFQPNTHGFYLCDDLSEARVLGMLKEADDDCQKAIRNIKGKRTSDDSQNEIIDLNEAVSCRLRLIRHFLVALLSLTGKEDSPSSFPTQSSKSSLTSSSSARCQNFEEAQRSLDQCKVLTERVLATQMLAAAFVQGPAPPNGAAVGAAEDEGPYDRLPCYVPNVNQRLLPPTFPRKPKLLAPADAVRYLRGLIEQLAEICCVLPQRACSFDVALKFFREFSRKDNCLLSRSVLQVAYNVYCGGGGNNYAFAETVKEAMRDFIQPPVLQPKCSTLSSSEPHCADAWNEFAANFSRVLPELVRTCGYNRARQRDRLAAALEDLAALQEEADRMDNVLHRALNTGTPHPGRYHLACLGSYVLYHVLVSMLDYLFLGFELELYAVHEYACMYWYAYEFLYRWLINVLHKADNFIYEQEQQAGKSEKTKGDNKKKKNANKKKQPTLKTHRYEIARLQSKQKLCEGYYRAMLGFYSIKRVRLPSLAEGQCYDAIRYEHRLAPFAHLATPPMIGYDQFLDISGFNDRVSNTPSSRLFADAAQCFDEARLGLENIPADDQSQNTVLIRICKMNAVILRLLSSGHQSDAKEWPIFDFQLHRYFPVVRIK